MNENIINIKLLEVYRLIEDLPPSREKNMITIKLDEAMMWFERIDPFEEQEQEEEESEV